MSRTFWNCAIDSTWALYEFYGKRCHTGSLFSLLSGNRCDDPLYCSKV